MSHSRGLYARLRERIQAFCYWLGPTYCILLGALILFGSFIVQLLTSIGVPFIKAFDFYRFDLSNDTFIELGMWAACNGRGAFIIPSRPDLNQPEEFNCPPPKWGWKTPQYSGITDNFFDRNLPKALIMHPISCCFTLFALVTALVTMKRQKQHVLLPIFSFLSCLFALCSFIIDVATFVPARSKLMNPNAYSVLGALVKSTELGPAFWLSLTCFVLDIVGNFIIIAGYGIWRYQRVSREQRRQSGNYARDVEMKAGSRMTRRGYFSNESTASLSDHSPYVEKESKVTEAERSSGTMSALSKHSTGSRSQPETQAVTVPPSAEHHNNNQAGDARSDMVEDVFMSERGDESEAEEDGYDSAVSNYADARSEVVGRPSRDASRSQVALPSGHEPHMEPPSSPRPVKRKPVERY